MKNPAAWTSMAFIFLFLSISACFIVGDITIPKLTDPIAQRIYAVSKIGLNFDQNEKILQSIIKDSMEVPK